MEPQANAKANEESTTFLLVCCSLLLLLLLGLVVVIVGTTGVAAYVTIMQAITTMVYIFGSDSLHECHPCWVVSFKFALSQLERVANSHV